MKKHKLVIVCLLCVAIILTGVLIVYKYSGEKYAADSTDWCGIFFMTDKGGFQVDGNYLEYYSPSSGKRVLVCNKAGCSHKEDCSAIFKDGLVGITYDKDGLLYLSEEGCSHHDEKILYHSDADGTNRKKLHLFNSIQRIFHVRFAGRYVFISGANLLDEDGNDLPAQENKVIVYDMEKKEERLLFQEQHLNSAIGVCSTDGEYIYFPYGYSDLNADDALTYSDDQVLSGEHYHTVIYRIPIAGGKKEQLAEGNDGMLYAPIADGKLIYCDRKSVYSYDIEKGEKKELMTGNYEVIPVFPEKDNHVILHFMDYDVSEQSLYYDFNVSSGAKRKIETEQLSLFAVMGDVAYYLDKDGKYGYCGKEEFLNGKVTKCSPFEDVVKKQLGE